MRAVAHQAPESERLNMVAYNDRTVFRTTNGRYLGIRATSSNTLFADFDRPSSPETQFEVLGPYNALVESCEFEKKHGRWHSSCDLPAVSTPKLFVGDCRCDGRVLQHRSTGRYLCEALPETCGGVSFGDTLGRSPNMSRYSVAIGAPVL
ncbi:MAG: hypothetical protein ACRBN8_40020 [Nannocystales bacterium]